jgi:hypothetical protein
MTAHHGTVAAQWLWRAAACTLLATVVEFET